VFFWGIWIGFFASLALYDWRTLRRIHLVTVAGFAWFVFARLVSTFG
jgi:hypothetical protein